MVKSRGRKSVRTRRRNPTKSVLHRGLDVTSEAGLAVCIHERDAALKQQAAAAEVLKVISRSSFDFQAVLDTLTKWAVKLCDADKGVISMQDGDLYRIRSVCGFSSEAQQYASQNPLQRNRGGATGRVALEGKAVHIPDVLADPEYTMFGYQRLLGQRTNLGVPLLREGAVIGIFSLTRTKVNPFTDRQIELVSTFAEQAVVAVENTRLLSELRRLCTAQFSANRTAGALGGLRRVLNVSAQTGIHQNFLDEGPKRREVSRSSDMVFVVDDDPQVREALTDLFASRNLDCVAFASATEYLRFANRTGPSCLVLDVSLPDINGLELQSSMTRSDHPPIVFISGHGDITSSVRAMKAGAIDFLTKPWRNEDLLQAVRQALEQDRQQRKIRAELMELEGRLTTLTPREREVLPLVARGLLNRQAAAQLGISEVTLQIHRSKVMQKMKAASLADLVRMAAKLDIS